MSKLPTGTSEGYSRLGQACARLVHPSIADAGERERQRRLVAVALAGPILMGGAFAQVLFPGTDLAVALAAICIVFVVGWTAAVTVAQTGSRAIAAPLLLACATAPVAMTIHLAGGVASPLFLAWLPLVLEPWFALRSRAALRAGLAAMAAAVTGAVVLSLLLPETVQPATGAHWLLPIAYGMTLWLRRAAFSADVEAVPAEAPLASVETLMPAVTLRLARGGEVVDCTDSARSLLRLEPEFLFGSGLMDRIHVSDRIAWLTALADLRDGVEHRHVELRLRLPADGQRRDGGYRAFALDLMGQGAADAGFVAILRDNAELAGLREALAEANRRAELGKARFLATVSHELRTPLNAIIGFSDMLESGMAGPLANDRQRDYVGLVRESGEHLLAIVNSILDVARIESGTYPILPENFRFADAVETSLSMVSCQAKAKGVTLERVLDAASGDLFADRRAIQQILINLLSNAVKFTPQGGRVTVTATRDPRRVTLSVADTGIGISAEDLSRIGRPFVQVLNDYTRQYEGTGLGLSLVKGLVELQDGSLTIDSAPGEGTLVTVTLPIRTPPRHQDLFDAEIVAIPPAAKPRTSADEAIRQSA
ncbi:HAMP domain-containing sensor histidine kinase [Aquibium sp. ELW1220]|uniref:sensor histidine kinase n=1 Tax=Aquibium sp. ELW1220 TaxID=2976766 RepID=UPI0025AF855D|nr:HAMP domain-containing sensor histidine kinase [Aquibium sp. ELW1220]MDN2583617.1 HAMP domain-containing histidine kinase [Aquibium sp. ELW1220]